MLFGLVRRRQLPVPTWKGFLLIAVIGGLGLWWFLENAYDFLAIDNRLTKADVVIVEGWVPDVAIQQAADELAAGRCEWICTAGVDLDRGDAMGGGAKDWANFAANSLRARGVPDEKLIIAPGGANVRQRTYAGFQAAKKKLEETFGDKAITINLISEGAHARRSWVVARKILGERYEFGMIPVEPSAFDPEIWWKSSSGVKHMLMEGIGFFYEWVGNAGR